MWSHYADSHKGFVLEFNPHHSFFDRRKKPNQIAEHLKQVRYSIKRPELILYNDNLSQTQRTDNLVKNFLWVKSKHWAYEQEWRIITTLNRSDKTLKHSKLPIHLFKFPQSAIKSIYFGCKMEETTISKFISLLNAKPCLNHIEIFQAYQNEKEYKLDFLKINTGNR